MPQLKLQRLLTEGGNSYLNVQHPSKTQFEENLRLPNQWKAAEK